jgi:long-chain acyl-CoA synthetase
MADIVDFNIELLPTTPTFLRMMLLSGLLDDGAPDCLKIVTYGTERMDQGTLERLCTLMPNVDFRQTFGMSELGILRVKSRARDSLWMKVGGIGVETKIIDGILKIRSDSRMIGYLNAPSPFDAEGWYDTKDVVENDEEWIRITGRISETISVGGVKFLPQEIERVALKHPAVLYAKASGLENPITGQHVELLVQLRDGLDASKSELRGFMRDRLPEHLWPHRIKIGAVNVGHRFKQL